MKRKTLYPVVILFFMAGGAFAQSNTVTDRERTERKERVKQNLKEAGQSLGEAATEAGQTAKEVAKKAGTAIGKGADKAAAAIETEADKVKARQRERRAENAAKRDTL